MDKVGEKKGKEGRGRRERRSRRGGGREEGTGEKEEKEGKVGVERGRGEECFPSKARVM